LPLPTVCYLCSLPAESNDGKASDRHAHLAHLRRAGLADDMCECPKGLYRPSAMPSGVASMALSIDRARSVCTGDVPLSLLVMSSGSRRVEGLLSGIFDMINERKKAMSRPCCPAALYPLWVSAIGKAIKARIKRLRLLSAMRYACHVSVYEGHQTIVRSL